MLRKFLIAAACVCALSSNAIIWHYGSLNTSKKTCALTSWSGSQPSSGKLTIPDTYVENGVTYKVTTIASHALDNLTTVKEIVIGANVENIGTMVNEESINLNGVSENFLNCPMLEKFTVSADNQMFKSTNRGALYLKKHQCLFRVPQNMVVSNNTYKLPDDLNHISPMAFAENTTITTLRIPGSATVGYNGGLNKTNIAEYELTSDPFSIDLIDGALVSTTFDWYLISVPPATKSSYINLTEKVKTLKDESCMNCVNLKGLNIPAVTSIDKRVFDGSGLETISFPSTISIFDTECMARAKNLKTINFAAQNIRLMVGFARDCSALETVTTVYPFREIEDAAFKNCRNLRTFPFSGATEMEGDSIFYNCGFDKIVYDDSYNCDDWGGNNLFCANRFLTEIDATAVQGTEENVFVLAPPVAKGCQQLAILKLPLFSSFVHYGITDGTTMKIPAFENVPLMHIEVGDFWAHEGDVVFSYSPINGNTDVRPNMYIAVTRTYDLNRDKTCWPLKGIFAGNNGAVVTPNFYIDAYKPADNYVAERGTYYIPGGCKGNYSGVVEAGLPIYELYRLDVTKSGGHLRVEAIPASGVTDMKVKVNDGSQFSFVNYRFTSDEKYEDVTSFTIYYKVNGIQFSTLYEPEFWTATGVESVEAEETGEFTVYDLAGNVLYTGDALSTEAGLYIIKDKGGKVSKHLVK